jgi:hypothetical protein
LGLKPDKFCQNQPRHTTAILYGSAKSGPAGRLEFEQRIAVEELGSRHNSQRHQARLPRILRTVRQKQFLLNWERSVAQRISVYCLDGQRQLDARNPEFRRR